MCVLLNVVVDYLVVKLRDLGLKVVRFIAKSREDVESFVFNLVLYNLVGCGVKGELKNLLKLKDEVGELFVFDIKWFVKLVRKIEVEIFNKVDVVCCICVGVGDKCLDIKFRIVLIDESI